MPNQAFYCQFKALEAAVRYGSQPDHPHLLYQYLDMGTQQAKEHSKAGAWQLHLQLFNTLLDTICDTTVAQHWRCLCLDNIYHPLQVMEQLAQSSEQQAQVHHLRYALYTLSDYFL